MAFWPFDLDWRDTPATDPDGPRLARWVMRLVVAMGFTFLLGLAIGWAV